MTTRLTRIIPPRSRDVTSILKSTLFYLAQHEHIWELFWKFCQNIQTKMVSFVIPNSSIQKAVEWFEYETTKHMHKTWNPVFLVKHATFCKIIRWCKASFFFFFCAGLIKSSLSCPLCAPEVMQSPQRTKANYSGVNMFTFQWQKEYLQHLVSSLRVHMSTCHNYHLECHWFGSHQNWTGFLFPSDVCRIGYSLPN